MELLCEEIRHMHLIPQMNLWKQHGSKISVKFLGNFTKYYYFSLLVFLLVKYFDILSRLNRQVFQIRCLYD